MKKIVWLFGQPGSGRKTLITKLLENDLEAKKALDLDCSKIEYLDLPYDRNYTYTDYIALNNRINQIYNSIANFITSDVEVLLFTGVFEDYSKIENSILKLMAEAFPDIDKEIFFLNPSDINVLHERLKKTQFYLINEKESQYRYQMDWLIFAVNYMKKNLARYKELGYKFIEVDTLDGYKIDKPKMLELKQD